jgi:hypothetical protein
MFQSPPSDCCPACQAERQWSAMHYQRTAEENADVSQRVPVLNNERIHRECRIPIGRRAFCHDDGHYFYCRSIAFIRLAQIRTPNLPPTTFPISGIMQRLEGSRRSLLCNHPGFVGVVHEIDVIVSDEEHYRQMSTAVTKLVPRNTRWSTKARSLRSSGKYAGEWMILFSSFINHVRGTHSVLRIFVFYLCVFRSSTLLPWCARLYRCE